MFFSVEPDFSIQTDFSGLPERLARARVRADLSINELASICGVSPNTIRNAERPIGDDELPTTKIDLIIKVANATSTPFEFLVLGSVPLERAQNMIEHKANDIYLSLKALQRDFMLAWGDPDKIK